VGEGEFGSTVELLDANVVLVMRPGFPDAGTQLGHEALVPDTRRFPGALDHITIAAEEFLPAGGSVAASVVQKGHGDASGAQRPRVSGDDATVKQTGRRVDLAESTGAQERSVPEGLPLGRGPVARSRARRLSVSNQNGAPRETAKKVISHPIAVDGSGRLSLAALQPTGS
jgi:hypothetical protein